jgi:phytoene dehydrogenase-like protein
MAIGDGATRMSKYSRACVIGAGPNGLAAATVLAQAGVPVDVFEAEPQPGGAARTLELTLPGFRHDFGSAVHPMAAGSPFFSSLDLPANGLEWIHSPSALAHPFDDGTAVTLERDLTATCDGLGIDGRHWRRLLEPFATQWPVLAAEILGPVNIFTGHPLLLARFGLAGLMPANTLNRFQFRTGRAKGLFAGLAAHSFLSLDEPLSAAFALVLGAAAHAVGWPIPRGGAQSITTALCTKLEKLGGVQIKTSSRVESLTALESYDLTLCDVTPRQLLRMGSHQLSPRYKRRLEKFRYGSGVFKVDYALSSPIPWTASTCLRAATVHLGGSAGEIAAAEATVREGRHAEKPFVLLAQPSLFDASRAPEGKHTAWAYCHVPHGSTVDVLDKIENQIERFAPGFRDTVLARHVFSPAALETMDANLVGGDINGGVMDIRQFLWRPTRRYYATSSPNLYLCSSSTPPGGGVHGMCGYHAARLAVSRDK